MLEEVNKLDDFLDCASDYESDFELEQSDDAAPLTSDLFHANYRGLSRSELEHFLVWPLDIRTKRKFQRQLKRCTKK